MTTKCTIGRQKPLQWGVLIMNIHINQTFAVPFQACKVLSIIVSTALCGYCATEVLAQAPEQQLRPRAEKSVGSTSTRRISGIASHYDNKSGRKTASGARFDEDAMTAAHLSLPFGTRLRVTYAGRSVVVTINDRGPFVRGRILDLSIGAARAIGLTDQGIGRVVAEVM